ncbi:Axial regulator YABBY 4 [Citrus sinensis]|nr:Axial regulator YABBY 4 [Citrus sinensis]
MLALRAVSSEVKNKHERRSHMVSVPCSSMSMVVTVRCGHCTSLLSVNMMKASFVPLHLLASFSHDDEPKEEFRKEEVQADQKAFNRFSPSILTSSDNEEEDTGSVINHVVNKPPERRQRAPSAYNRFIKEEIRRLKTENPNMAHKEAFSTAAKNVRPLEINTSNMHLKFWSCLTTLSGPNVLQFSTKEMEKAAVAKKRKSKLGTLKLPIGFTYKAMVSAKEKLQGIPSGRGTTFE